MKKRYLLVLCSLFGLVLFLLAPAGAALSATPAAPEPTGYKNVTVWVNPEYDDPRLLVMIQGQIDGVTAPATVRFLVPTGAEMYSAGYKDSQNTYYRAPDWTGDASNIKPSGIAGWDEVSFTVNNGTFRTEYYVDSIDGLPGKTFHYEFHALYPVQNLNVVVQEPKGSSQFAIQPAAQSSGTDADGLKVNYFSYPSVNKDGVVALDVSYTKADSKPSLASNTSSPTSFPFWAVGVGVVLVLGIAIIMAAGKSGRRPAPKARNAGGSRHTPRPARGNPQQAGGRFRQGKAQPPRGQPQTAAKAPGQVPGGQGASASAVRFCHNCGAKLEAPGRFCPECGTER